MTNIITLIVAALAAIGLSFSIGNNDARLGRTGNGNQYQQETSYQNGMGGMRNNNGQTNQDDEYIIDDADFIQAHNLLANVEASELSTEEAEGLILMREEEKLAHDVYYRLGEMWNLQVFYNIANSEQTHTETMEYLLDRYEITDPVTDTTVGVFTNPDFDVLYQNLVEQGSESIEAALRVGATIEDLDINDLNILSQETDNQDILDAYANLTKGSRNHLRSFVRQLESQGATYEPQYISQAEYESIISTQQERGQVRGGRGRNA